jgi:hypothetical protein
MPLVRGLGTIRHRVMIGVMVHRLQPEDTFRELNADGPKASQNGGQAG